MAKNKSHQGGQQVSQGQKRGSAGGSQGSKKQNGPTKPSRGCCGCLCGLLLKLVTLSAVAAALYVAVFTGYSYHIKQRIPTLDEFKDFSEELYLTGRERGLEYYKVAKKYTDVYYAHFEKHHLPVIRQYSKEYTKLAGEQLAQLKVLACKYIGLGQEKAIEYYKLALKTIENYQSGGQPEPVKPSVTTPRPAAAPSPKATAPPTPKAAPPTPKAAPTTTRAPTTTPPPPTPAPKKEAPKQTPPPPAKKAASSKERKAEL